MKILESIFGYIMPFYEGEGAGGGNNTGTETAGQETSGADKTDAERAPTFDDLLKGNKEYQSEFDRRVAKALETKRVKWETELKQKLKQEKDEAARLAKLTAEKWVTEKFKKEREKFQNKKASFMRESIELKTIKLLAEEKLPIEFAPILIENTAKNTKKKIVTLKKVFNTAIDAAVTKRMKGDPTKAGEKLR